MMWREFIDGTGCKDTEYNYRIYKGLESLYMDSDSMTKEEVYKAGKELVDNSQTEEELKALKYMAGEILSEVDSVEHYQRMVEHYRSILDMDKNDWFAKSELKIAKDGLKEAKQKLAISKYWFADAYKFAKTIRPF